MMNLTWKHIESLEKHLTEEDAEVKLTLINSYSFYVVNTLASFVWRVLTLQRGRSMDLVLNRDSIVCSSFSTFHMLNKRIKLPRG